MSRFRSRSWGWGVARSPICSSSQSSLSRSQTSGSKGRGAMAEFHRPARPWLSTRTLSTANRRTRSREKPENGGVDVAHTRSHASLAVESLCRRHFLSQNFFESHGRDPGKLESIAPVRAHLHERTDLGFQPRRRTNEIIARRTTVLNTAWATHPERFVKGVPKPKPLPDAVWINPPHPSLTTQKIAL